MPGYRIKRIIDGKTYNTETATVVFENWNDDPSLAGVVLYQTRHGSFFKLVVDHHGEQHSFGPLTDAEAQAFLEKCNATEALEQCFGLFPEAGAAETRLTIRIPGNLATRVEAAAKAKDMSINTYAMRCVESCVASDVKAQRPPINRNGNPPGWTDEPDEADRDPFSEV
jgi:predicted HicB family RNase H-like nuclease